MHGLLKAKIELGRRQEPRELAKNPVKAVGLETSTDELMQLWYWADAWSEGELGAAKQLSELVKRMKQRNVPEMRSAYIGY